MKLNSKELLERIYKEQQRLNEELTSMKTEYNELESRLDSLSRAEIKKATLLKKKINALAADIQTVDNQKENYLEARDKVQELSELVAMEQKDQTRRALEQLEVEKQEYLSRLEEELETYYPATKENQEEKEADGLNGEEETELDAPKNDKRNTKKNAVIAGVSAVALLFTIGAVVHFSNKDESPALDDSQDPAIEQPYEKEEVETPELIQEETEEATFTDITDKEQVALRANEILESISSVDPSNDFTVEEIENILAYLNGGAVKGAISPQSALFVITRIETLMNKENLGEAKDALNLGLFLLDGSQGQKLANKIYELRQGMLKSETDENFDEYAQDFGSLLVCSWVLNGANGEVSAYALETSGMKALVDKYFLNTIAIAQSRHDESQIITIMYLGEETEFNLEDVNKQINEANCPTSVTADNGDNVQLMMNKFSADMIGMVNEATYAQGYSLSLK